MDCQNRSENVDDLETAERLVRLGQVHLALKHQQQGCEHYDCISFDAGAVAMPVDKTQPIVAQKTASALVQKLVAKDTLGTFKTVLGLLNVHWPETDLPLLSSIQEVLNQCSTKHLTGFLEALATTTRGCLQPHQSTLDQYD